MVKENGGRQASFTVTGVPQVPHIVRYNDFITRFYPDLDCLPYCYVDGPRPASTHQVRPGQELRMYVVGVFVVPSKAVRFP